MSCNLYIDGTELNNAVVTASKGNKILADRYITRLKSEAFAKEVKDKLGININEIPKSKLEEVVKLLQESHNRENPNINYSTQLNTSESNYAKYGYDSVSTREFCKKVATSFALNAYHKIIHDYNKTVQQILDELEEKTKHKFSPKEYFANAIHAKIKQLIRDRAVSRGLATNEEIMQIFMTNNTAKLEALFANDNLLEDNNLLALHKEILGNRVAFFEEIFRNDILGELRLKKAPISEDVTYEAIDEQLDDQDSPESNASTEDDKNNTIRELNEKLGDYNNFMTHVSMSIRGYFSSLPRLINSTKVDGKYNEDKNNPLGIAEPMSATQCIAVLYAYGDFVNTKTMINSIREIADRVPGMASFCQFADYLDSNPNFAFEVYRTFSKSVVNKIETTDASGEFASRNSNRTANKLTALKFEFFNSSKSTSILSEAEHSFDILKGINNRIKDLREVKKELDANYTEEDKKAYDNEVKNIASELYKILKRYYPTVSDKAILNYVRSDNELNTISNLYNISELTIKGAKASQLTYDSRQADINSLFSQKYKLNEDLTNGARIPASKFKEIDEKLSQLYATEYVSKDTQMAAFQLAEALVEHSLVKTELNSRNVHGNQSSDVINNSMITNIINTLKDKTSLQNFGKYKGQSRQYDFSNIMIEHRDENDKIINYGLFVQNPESGELTPTPYAHRLLQNSLFSGAGSVVDGKNVLYSEMSRGDYTVTAFINFFKTEDEFDNRKEADKITFANYFMRIPSDAPKNFIMKAPKYSVVGLFNKDGVNINHPIFKQFRQVFVQELQDMATAINVLFEHEGGKVRLDRDINSPTYGMPIFKDGFGNDAESIRKLYDNYHKKKGKILEKVSEGRYKLVGDVFTSDRFKVTIKDENGKLKPVNFADEILKRFDFLYGGANGTYLRSTTVDNGVKVDFENLTDNQKSIIDEQISKFIIAYSGRAVDELNTYASFIPEGMMSKLNAAEFALNHRLTYIGFNDLFEGDTKFYKDTQTFLKRAKESQGSGVPYGIVDYQMDLTAPRTVIDSALNKTVFNVLNSDGSKGILNKFAYDKAIANGNTHEEALAIANTIQQTNKFRGVTIKNTIRTGDTIGTFKKNKDGKIVKWVKNEKGELVEDDKNGNYIFDKPGVLAKTLIDALVKNGMSKPNAKIHAANMMAGYANTTVNDAQSYITFEEWVRRVTARGQLGKYKALIDAVLDETKPLDAKTIGEFIQVQKNFYYDQHYNSKLGIIAPRQIKNAEFVIVPRLVRGTQLEQVYNLMQEYGVDQLNTEETSKAGKCNVLTLWDNDGNLTESNIEDFKAHATESIELYNYNYLYTQQETPQHLASENKAGIQIMKKIVDNIDASNEKLFPLKARFFELYSQNIIDSYANLVQRLHIKQNKDGEIDSFDKAILYDMLRDEVSRLGLDSNMLDYVTLDKDGEPMMPSYMSNVSTKLESIAQSLINNNITRQKLPGWHAAQITNVGWRAMNENVEKRSYSKELKYHPDGKPYVEIMLPKSNFKNLNYYNADGTLKSDEQLLKELEDAGIDMMIGYRIPTEGKQSVCVMKVVGFTDDALGSTIVVPDDWVAQTGSDFDIDSVYGIHFTGEIDKETGKLKKVDYNKEDKRFDRKTAGRNNEILQTMIDILSNPSSLEENLSRSNFEDIIKDRDSIISKEVATIRAARSPYDFFEQAAYQEDVMSGAKLKAFSVTRDTFCSICNTVKPTIAAGKTISIVYKKSDGYKESELKKHFSDVKKLRDGSGWIVTHNTLGWSLDNKNVVGKILTAYSSQTTAHILDAVKEGSIPNVNDFTFQVYKMFPDIGSDYKTAIAFMMQPGVSKIVNIYNSNKSIYGEDSGNVINEAIKSQLKTISSILNIKLPKKVDINSALNSLKDYNTTIAKLFDVVNSDKFQLSNNFESINALNISSSTLIDRINQADKFDTTSPVGELNRALYDLGVILQYKKLNSLASDISDYARVCNPDKFGAKQTIYSTAKVFDDIKELTNKSSSLKIGNNSFISSIYPSAHLGLDRYIEETTMTDSSYPPLNSFLRYATAFSIKINRRLFPTQSDEFRREIEKIEDLFSDGRTLNENLYKEVQNYILNDVYSQARAIRSKVTFKNGNFVYTETNLDEERARIYGYGQTPNLEVTNKDGEVIEFNVQDINHPTEDEIEQFVSLSPAQKIQFIQNKYEDSGVFKYIKVSPFNTGSKSGQQTIQYIENNEDIETVYHEFEKTFFNDNPLVALAAMDVIKYGFVVEGFKMRKNAVNKVIKNSVLLSDKTNIISDISVAVETIKSNTIGTNQLRRNFIRSHQNTVPITTKKVFKYKDNKGIWHNQLNPISDGIVIVEPNLAEKYGIVYNSTPNDDVAHFETNSYVRLNIDNDTNLYRITEFDNKYILYPLNSLEENENSTFSSNSRNNKWPSEDYYLGIINDYRDQLRERDVVISEQLKALKEQGREITEADIDDINYNTDEIDFISVLKQHREERNKYKYKPKKLASGFAKAFNINDKNSKYTGGFEDVINKVRKKFDNNPFATLYLRSNALTNFITSQGIKGSSIQTIDGKRYIIQKVNFSGFNKKYIGEENKDVVVKEKNLDIQRIMEEAKSTGENGVAVTNVFMITPYEENVEVKHSSVTEQSSSPDATMLGVQSMRTMFSRRKSEGDIDAAKALKTLQDKQITGATPSVMSNQKEVIQVTAEYVHGITEKIFSDMKYFIKDEQLRPYPINSPEAIAAIKTDNAVKQRFLKTLLDARAIVKNYAMVNELDIQSQDEVLRPFLNKIKEDINRLQNATIIAETEKLFANEFLAKLSNNPLIQQDILGVLDGYHSASAFDAWVGDLQETSSPLLQIISKEVMGDIRSKEMKAVKRVQEFKKTFADIKRRAKEAGVNIDWKKIIDENGKFIQHYNQAFLDKLAELREDISLAKTEHGTGSIEHLKAKLAYDKWKLANIHQPIVDDYYRRKIEIEERMLGTDENPGFRQVYSAYKKLANRRRELLSHVAYGVLADNYKQELEEVKREIDNLTNDYIYDVENNTFIEKYQVGDPNNHFTGNDAIIYSLNSAYALQGYLKDMKELDEEYFDSSVKFGFQEELDKNLDIINNYEMRDANGNITTPIPELMKHEDYVKAKEWLAQNARYTADEGVIELVNSAFSVFDEKKQGRKILSVITKTRKAYDERGVIDARKFDENDIQKIYEEQQNNYGINENQVFTDRTLISNSPTDDTIFKPEFYKGMTVKGAKNNEYLAKVNEINKILKPHFTTHNNTLNTTELTEDELKTLRKLYEELDEIKKYQKGTVTNGKSVGQFIKNNVEFVYDETKFQQQEDLAKQKGEHYYRIWKSVNTQIIEDENGVDKVVPNRYIYGYAVPKGYKADGTGNNDFVDKDRTNAIHTIRNYTRIRKTQYYYEAYKEAQAKGNEEFRKWYQANHIYNPYTHTIEPIQCWTTMEFGEVGDDGVWDVNMSYSPSWTQTEKTISTGLDENGDQLYDEFDMPITDKRNSDYKEFSSTASNYKGDNSEYNSEIKRNNFEEEVKELFETILKENCHTLQSQQFLRSGYMPLRKKNEEMDAKRIGKEALKLIGWINNATGKENWYTDSEIDYSTDTVMNMPMTTLLKSKDSVKINRNRPVKDINMTDEEYNAAVKKWEDDKAKAEAQNMKIHRDMLDNNWESVMEEFIHKAAHFNAIQDNKYMLFYAKNMIDKIDVYVKNEGFNDLQKTGKQTIEGDDTYVTKKDTRLQEQYTNWIRRLVYDQWKKPNNGLTRAANILQSLTSAKFMMLNITGGIANVTVGSTQILGEVFAKEYFGNKTWHLGLNTWRAGLPSFMADMYKDKASSLPSAIIKFMNVVDFDENNGIVSTPNMAEYLKRARDAAFSPQAVGEHMMQNGAMFAMMYSHRLIKTVDSETSETKYKAMNESEYMRDAHEKALLSIMTDEQRQLYESFKKKELSNANNSKEYVWFRKDLTTEFVNIYFNNEDKQKFIDKRKKYQNKAKEEFNNDENPTIISQLKLGDDGILDFKDGSIFSEIGDEAYKILGDFKGRVISVNKKIHGVYDKLGAAKWESYWWGGLVMQYHKHIYPGIMKRYRRQGYFNEERGTIEKGCYASIKDFLTLPLHKKKFAQKLKEDNNMTDANIQVTEGIQNIIKSYIEFALHATTYYEMLNEYDRANIRRAFGDFCGVASALMLAIALHAGSDDDDEHNLIYNLAMYEADRLATESFMYNPMGAVSEFKKLWSSPIAAQNGILDLTRTFGLIAQYMIQGDDFDPYYSTGLYQGEHKIWVRVRNNIPMYHGINMIERLERSNKYYKLEDNMLSIVPVKDIADFISE